MFLVCDEKGVCLESQAHDTNSVSPNKVVEGLHYQLFLSGQACCLALPCVSLGLILAKRATGYSSQGVLSSHQAKFQITLN